MLADWSPEREMGYASKQGMPGYPKMWVSFQLAIVRCPDSKHCVGSASRDCIFEPAILNLQFSMSKNHPSPTAGYRASKKGAEPQTPPLSVLKPTPPKRPELRPPEALQISSCAPRTRGARHGLGSDGSRTISWVATRSSSFESLEFVRIPTFFGLVYFGGTLPAKSKRALLGDLGNIPL